MKRSSGNWLYLIIVAAFSILGMKALIHPGLFTAHDIWHQVVRLYYYYQGISDGQIPPVWIGQLANSFGYPLFLFSYHLPWIIGIPFLEIGFDIPNTLKILFFLSFLTSGFSMYFFAKNLLENKLAASLSAILYLWLPYHFLVTFVSASIGVAFVFTFLPLVFLGINLLKQGKRAGILMLSIGLSGIILSHIMHLVFLSPIILIFFFWGFQYTQRKIHFLKEISIGIILGVLISSFYLIPAVYYNNFTRVHQETGFYELYKRNFVNFSQLVYSKWGYSPIVNNAKNGEISFQLGIVQWISILGLISLVFLRKLNKKHQALSLYLLFGFIVSIFLMLDLSGFIWKFLVRLVAIDYPFRLLLPASFIASIAAGIIVVNINSKLQKIVFVFLILVVLYTNRNHINVNQYTNFPISTYLNIETEITTNTFNEYLPIKADGKLLNKPWNEVVGENMSALNTIHKTNLLSFNLNVTKEGSASAGQFNFPGQALYLDSKPYKFDADKEGRINFNAPKGNYTVTIKYQETFLMKISKLLTITGILITLYFFLKEIKLFNKKRTFD